MKAVGLYLRKDQIDRLNSAGCRVTPHRIGKKPVFNSEGDPIFDVALPTHVQVENKGCRLVADIRRQYEDGNGKRHWSPRVQRMSWTPMENGRFGKLVGLAAVDKSIT